MPLSRLANWRCVHDADACRVGVRAAACGRFYGGLGGARLDEGGYTRVDSDLVSVNCTRGACRLGERERAVELFDCLSWVCCIW